MSTSTNIQSVESLPRIVYKEAPVITTELLASVYGVNQQQIRQNFANNSERFVEGKHFFKLSGNELSEFQNYVENFDIVVPKRSPHFLLWTDRGAARHAKSLKTNQAWDVFEILEDNYFAKTSQPAPQPLSLTPSTAGDRAALCALVKTWAMVSKMRFSHCWKQLNGHFNLERISDLPREWIPEALSFVQGRIDSLPKALPEPEATPVPVPVRHPEVEEYKRRMDALLAAAKAINPDNIVMRAQLEAGAKRFARRDLWPVQQALFDAIGASAAAVESFRRLIDAAQSVAEG